MEGSGALSLRRLEPRRWKILTGLALAAPLVSLAIFLQQPAENVRLQTFAGEHFAVTTNVALVAAVIALLFARSALDRGGYRTLLVALGFMSMAGIFTVHGLATPGVLFTGVAREAVATLVASLSSQLSLLVPAVLFATRYTGLVARLERSALFGPRPFIAVTAGAIVIYGLIGIGSPEVIAGAMELVTGPGSRDVFALGYSATYQHFGIWLLLAATLTTALLLFAAWRQASDFARSRLPSHAALGVSYLLLAEAQLAMAPGAASLAAFWEYHGLMAAAALIAMLALFIELDRRRGLERFLPPTLVERVVTGDRLSLSGERRMATILFTDLRDSTSLAERISPEATIDVLNAYLRTMATAVIAEGGILDKFTGDGLMAIFGAMSDPAAGAAAAARAARRIRSDVATLNAERARRSEPVAGYGVGVHTGPVVLGTVGLPDRSDYTAIGDTVNTAARMEELTKELSVDVVISGETAALLQDPSALRPLGEARVRGKERPIPVYTVR